MPATIGVAKSGVAGSHIPGYRTASIALLAFLLVGLSSPPSTIAQESDSAAPFGILSASDAPLMARPGGLATKAFYVSNRSARISQVALSVQAPPGFLVVAGEERLDIEVKEGDTVLISLFVPSATPSGSYDVTLRLYDPAGNRELARTSYALEIVPDPSVSITHLDSPVYVIAGELYTSRFDVENTGNVPLEVEISSKSGLGFEHSFGASRLALAPDERRELRVLVRTPADLESRAHHVLRVFVSAGSASDSATAGVDVLPRVSGSERRYHALPVSYSIEEAIRKGETVTAAALARFDASGPLGTDDFLDLHIQAPFDSIGMFTAVDPELSVTYRRDRWDVYVGSGFFTVSDLLVSSVFGYGARGEYRLGDVAVGGQHLTTSMTGDGAALTSAYLELGRTRSSRARLSLMDHRDRGTGAFAGGVEAYGVHESGVRVEGEYAVAAVPATGEAYRIALADTRSGFSYSLGALHADPGFIGQLDDLTRFEAAATASLGDATSAAFSVSRSRSELDAALPTASETCAVSLRHQATDSVSLALGGRSVVAETDPDPESATDTSYAEARMRYAADGLSIVFTGEVETSRVRTGARNSTSDTLGVDLGYRFKTGATLSASLAFSGNRTVADPAETELAVSYTDVVREVLELDLRYTSTSNRASFYSGRDMLEIGIRGMLPDDSSLSLAGKYTPGRIAERYRDFEISLEYAGHLSLPVRRLPQGRIAGYVRDAETGGGIPEAILTIGDRVAVSGLDGSYLFQSLPPGIWYLSVDASRVPGDHLVVEETPIEVEVVGDGTVEYDIHLTNPCDVRGTVTKYTYGGSAVGGDGRELTEDGGLADVIVEVSGERGRARAVTRRDGSFQITGVHPGRWMVTVDHASLPDGFTSVPESVELTLEPGEAASLAFRVEPVKRPITIQEGGGVLEETPREE